MPFNHVHPATTAEGSNVPKNVTCDRTDRTYIHQIMISS